MVVDGFTLPWDAGPPDELDPESLAAADEVVPESLELPLDPVVVVEVVGLPASLVLGVDEVSELDPDALLLPPSDDDEVFFGAGVVESSSADADEPHPAMIMRTAVRPWSSRGMGRAPG